MRTRLMAPSSQSASAHHLLVCARLPWPNTVDTSGAHYLSLSLTLLTLHNQSPHHSHEEISFTTEHLPRSFAPQPPLLLQLLLTVDRAEKLRDYPSC